MHNLVIYTICQGDFIYDNFLKQIDFFKTIHKVYIQNYKDELSNDDLTCIQAATIFIYQPVSSTHGIKSTENEDGVLKLLQPTCRRICFPSLYLDMWPIYLETEPYVGGETLDNYENQGLTLEEVLELYDTNKYNFNLQKRVDYCIGYMRRKEDLYCNIKVVDFIEKHYKTWKLFDTQNHPNGIIGLYIAKQICNLLSIQIPDQDEFECSHIKVIQFEWPHSRYMKQELGIEYAHRDDSHYYKNNLFIVYKQQHLKKYKIEGNPGSLSNPP